MKKKLVIFLFFLELLALIQSQMTKKQRENLLKKMRKTIKILKVFLINHNLFITMKTQRLMARLK